MLFALVFLLGLFLAPLLQVLARRLFMRLGHPLAGFPAIAVVALLFPVLAFAQTAVASTPAPNPILAFVLQCLPWLLGVLLTLFVANQTGITGRLQAWHDAADTTATMKGISAGALLLDHVAADFAGLVLHQLQTNPNAKAADLVTIAAASAKQTLNDDGKQMLSDGLGIAVDGIEARIGAAIAGKLQGVQTHAAAVAGAQAVAGVQALPLNQVAEQLVAKS